MKLPRRKFLHLAAGAAVLPAGARSAGAQSYPMRPVRIIVGFTPAGATDILARLIGQWLSERLGQPFIVENRPGGGSNIGTEAVARAPADGYTLLLVAPANAINATLYDRLNFNFVRDIAPVAGLIRVANVMEVNPSLPAWTLPEFVAYARPIPARSTTHRPAQEASSMSPASCSR
jgi:tripartite-type tricarboxylate transporter receptor subunit TctC